MTCHLCQSDDVGPLPFPVPPEAGRWGRCRACGSDVAAHAYDPSIYQDWEGYSRTIGLTDVGQFRDNCRWNCEWFQDHAAGLPNRDFLDVGCWHGAALDVMQSMGWAVHGFDVVPPPYYGPHVTVGPFFHRWLFPNRYAAVLCMEVLEHVPDPDLLLHELHGVACPGGLVQVITPKPADAYSDKLYQRSHLFLASPDRLRKMLDGAMLDVIEFREWDATQAYLLRARS